MWHGAAALRDQRGGADLPPLRLCNAAGAGNAKGSIPFPACRMKRFATLPGSLLLALAATLLGAPCLLLHHRAATPCWR